jgi:DNA repair exonuclease SbcCD ATPase subunit
MLAHRFLEQNKETHTVKELRDKLYAIGIERIKLVPLCYYYIFKYNVDWHALVNAPQGDNQEEVTKAQKMLESVQTAFVEVQKTAEAAAQREKEAQIAKKEQEASLAEVQAQEKAYNDKTAQLTKATETGGMVAQNKAKAELAAHLAENPLPLRKAKITNEAAVKKAERALDASTAAKAAAEAAVESARDQVAKAEAYLQELMAKPGSAGGALWWIDRELHEAKAFLPSSKGGYRKKDLA